MDCRNREPNVENPKWKTDRWKWKVYIDAVFLLQYWRLKFENRESQAESRILCRTKFSFRAFNAEIDNINSKIPTWNSKIENKREKSGGVVRTEVVLKSQDRRSRWGLILLPLVKSAEQLLHCYGWMQLLGAEVDHHLMTGLGFWKGHDLGD